MAFRIIDRNSKNPLNEQNSGELQAQHAAALSVQAQIWASRKIGDPDSLSQQFLAKVNDVRAIDSGGAQLNDRALVLGKKIRVANLPHLHDEKSFDLDKILQLL